jgi:hypothetical protein
MRASEWEGFEIVESVGPVTRKSWQLEDAVLDWHVRGEGVDIVLSSPSPYRLRTRWPAFLPSPLFTLHPGDIVRIDWNGRLRMSLFGSDRSSYYEQHTYWLALCEAPHTRLFLDAQPRKHVDLRADIY